jgi:hypothetical protein
MVVGDIFRNSTNHKVVVKEMILFALDIVKEIKKIKTPDNIPLCIRIGINMGSVSVGILGNEIPRLCVVGNTVNMASRLQSTAEIDTIQLSRHVYEQLEEIEFDIKFEVILKENVFLKNIGSITTYNIPPPLFVMIISKVFIKNITYLINSKISIKGVPINKNHLNIPELVQLIFPFF